MCTKHYQLQFPVPCSESPSKRCARSFPTVTRRALPAANPQGPDAPAWAPHRAAVASLHQTSNIPSSSIAFVRLLLQKPPQNYEAGFLQAQGDGKHIKSAASLARVHFEPDPVLSLTRRLSSYSTGFLTSTYLALQGLTVLVSKMTQKAFGIDLFPICVPEELSKGLHRGMRCMSEQ